MEPTRIDKPYFIAFDPSGKPSLDGEVTFHVYPVIPVEGFAILIGDLIGHVADAFGVDRNQVMAMVLEEFNNPSGGELTGHFEQTN